MMLPLRRTLVRSEQKAARQRGNRQRVIRKRSEKFQQYKSATQGTINRCSECLVKKTIDQNYFASLLFLAPQLFLKLLLQGFFCKQSPFRQQFHQKRR